MSSVVPVVVLGDSPTLEHRLEAFRRGAAAVLARSPSMDGMASRLAELAKEIPDRTSQSFDELGESTLLEFVQALSEQLRTQVLAKSRRPNRDPGPARVRGGRPLARLVDEFVQRLGHHVVHAEAVAHELVAPGVQEGSVLRATELGEVNEPQASRASRGPRGRRRSPGRRRGSGSAGARATVLVLDLSPSDPRFARLRQLDPKSSSSATSRCEGSGGSSFGACIPTCACAGPRCWSSNGIASVPTRRRCLPSTSWRSACPRLPRRA